MKKVLSIMLAAVMLCGLFVMPVSAAEDVVWSAASGYFALGANTARDEDGKVVLDEAGDSFEVVLETDRSGVFLLAGNFWSLNGAHDIATAVEFDGVRVGVCDLAAQYVKDSFSNNLYNVNVEAGRHTVRIVNMRGSYAISSLRFVNAGGVVPATYSTRASYEFKGTVFKDYRYGSMFQYGKNNANFDLAKHTVIATIGVEEDGLYELSWDVMNYFNGGSAAPDVYDVKVTAGGNVYSKIDAGNADVWKANKDTADTEKMKTDATYRKQMYGYTTWVNKVLVNQVALSKGTHKIVIESEEPYNYSCLVDKVYLKKVGEVTAWPEVVADFDFATSNKSAAGVAKASGISLHPYMTGNILNGVSACGWIEATINVANAGEYIPTLTWWANGEGNRNLYPYVYVDGVLVWSDMINDNTSQVGHPEANASKLADAMLSPLGSCYLTEGEHTIRLLCANGYPTVDKITFKKNTSTDGSVVADVPGFDAEKSAGVTLGTGNGGYVVTFDADSYAHVGAIAPEAGFYSVGATIAKTGGSSAIEVAANGTKAEGAIVGVEGSSYRTVPIDGMLYLNKGINDLTVRVDGMALVTDAIVLTPANWADRVISPKEGELYEGEVTDANLAKSVKANTEYTAVADIGGAYVNKGVALIVAVYEGGILKAAYAENGTAQIGSTIKKTFTTPEAEGNYTVKVFVMDSLSSFKPYTEQTEIAPAVAE